MNGCFGSNSMGHFVSYCRCAEVFALLANLISCPPVSELSKNGSKCLMGLCGGTDPVFSSWDKVFAKLSRCDIAASALIACGRNLCVGSRVPVDFLWLAAWIMAVYRAILCKSLQTLNGL